ncbi:hypothetical protein [Fictibacillus enclensis]|uniref:hypothetical protein n=1 Tax=Fictibacillus enclensis TaxID=1017270 RepID=UPI003B96959D
MGCFHHIAPHRRMNYIGLIKKALKPNGFFAITCFLQSGDLGVATYTIGKSCNKESNIVKTSTDP